MRTHARRLLPWAALLFGMFLGAGVPWVFTAWRTNEPPEIRAFQVGDKPSALIVDDDSRLLLIQLDDREEAARAFGVMARPWEPRPQMLIAPANDRFAVGLWEALQHFDPAAVLVLGAAGADPLWAQIEHECRSRRIELRFVAGVLSFQTARLELTLLGTDADGEGATAVVVRRGAMNVLIAAGAPPPDVTAQLVIGDVVLDQAGQAALITTRPVSDGSHVRQVVMQEREIIHVKLDGEHVGVSGGVLLDSVAATPTATPE